MSRWVVRALGRDAYSVSEIGVDIGCVSIQGAQVRLGLQIKPDLLPKAGKKPEEG